MPELTVKYDKDKGRYLFRTEGEQEIHETTEREAKQIIPSYCKLEVLKNHPEQWFYT